ncbi:ABC transporter permease [Sphingomonas crocodyli]|uniref:ABC transporter permease n=1 Tax=Sphingomonas crocodyli TaxID=1979270 RepID=A0A437MBD6_9SPHN|nr:ABC transporter permease [Sphingomonas crocodyli]RVT94952.1 ABC transporter permease [Sphingomonas crocodyli]
MNRSSENSFWIDRQLIKGLQVQGRVLKALFMREVLTRYGRHNIGFLWLFVEPMMFTLGVTTLWYFAKANHGSDLPITAFALSGYSSVLLWRNMPARCVAAIEPNLPLMYHRQVRVLDCFLSRLMLEAAGATMSFTLLSVFYLSIEWVAPPEDVMKVVAAWLLLAWFGAALALTIGSLAFFSETVEKLWHPMSYVIFPLSGAGFIVDALPPEFQKVILYFPMVHGIEYLREGYFGSKVHSIYDVPYLVLINVGLTFVGLALSRIVSRRIVPG